MVEKKKKKIVIDKMEGLKVLCSCGERITSLRTFYLNSLDIGRWECKGCGESYLIETELKKLGTGTIPEKKMDSPRKCVRLKCTNCGNIIYTPKTNYVNRLPKKSRWRCNQCGTIYELKAKCRVGLSTEVI